MHIKRRRGWEIPERLATPEAVYLNRRELIAASGLALFGGLVGAARRRPRAETDPTADLYPAPRNSRYTIGPGGDAGEDQHRLQQLLRIRHAEEHRRPGADRCGSGRGRSGSTVWSRRSQTLGIDDLIRRIPLEERLYRHRCVEAWSMTVPWTGFPLAALVELAKPPGFREISPHGDVHRPGDGHRADASSGIPWPYVEALTMAEATNELAFLVTGAYGKPVAKSMGAPLRLHLPWKYGFKSIKSIVRFTFTEERPITFWQQLAPDEYGFWANVNPEVPHPRWSQARERDIGTGERIPTRLFNGYGEYVAALYSDAGDERLYM